MKKIVPESDQQISQQMKPGKNLRQRLQLEGECKIVELVLLETACIKGILLIIPFIISIVGLFCLKYSKSLRVKVFYNEANFGEATHVYLKGNEKRQEKIVKINRMNDIIFFEFNKLKYEYRNHKAYPVGLDLEYEIQQRLDGNYMKEGLSINETIERRKFYGPNQHIVDSPQYFQYIYDVMTEPFFFIIYLAAVIYFIQKLNQLSYLLVGSVLLTSSINYILLYISYRKIKEMAEKVEGVTVLRGGQFSEVESTEIVPGDLLVPDKNVICDMILLQGEIYVNEANLTGQSVPIGKNALVIDEVEHIYQDNNKWLYEGSSILSVSENSLAMAVNCGYSSKKGKILRKILNKHPSSPHFFKTFVIFLCITYVVGVIAYLVTLPMRLQKDNLEGPVIGLNFLLIITFAFPPAFPIYFNLVYSYCLIRLKWKDILGTEPQKTVESAHLKTMCFDKTGTLTEDKVNVHKILKFNPNMSQNIKNQFISEENKMHYKIFGSCHTVKQFNNQKMGDEIDLKTFMESGYKLCQRQASDVRSFVETEENKNEYYNKLQILKVFQYESKFQSMSCLVYDFEDNKHYVFVKGAPEVVFKNSVVQPQYFDDLLQNVSYGGFRTIGYGFKQIPFAQKDHYKNLNREAFMKDITMLGMLVFENKLKEDAVETIKLLKNANIQSKIITGDNIYIAIETGSRCDIINKADLIFVCEGKNQLFHQNSSEEEARIRVKVFKFDGDRPLLTHEVMSFEEYQKIQKPIIVDNEFFNLMHRFPINESIAIFARISPQNKAKIVEAFKEKKISQRRKLTRSQRILSKEREKIGMVGDGANDLLAIKAADIGIGIRNCDSSYASSFSILHLMHIDEIVRESKCTERQIIEICRIVCIGAYLSIPILIIFETEASFISPQQILFSNFTKYLLFPLIIGLSGPTKETTPYKPCSNFLKQQNQLVFWGNVILGSIGYGALLIYYRSTDGYVEITKRGTVDSAWNFKGDIVTCVYLFYELQPSASVFFIYESSPWKEPIFKNVVLMLFFILNFGFSITRFFIHNDIKQFLDLQEVPRKELFIMFLIAMLVTLLTFIFNVIIGCLNIHQKEFEEDFQENRAKSLRLDTTTDQSPNML